MTWNSFKKFMYPVLVGTAVTCLTSLLQAAIQWLNGPGDNIIGGAAGAVVAAIQNRGRIV